MFLLSKSDKVSTSYRQFKLLQVQNFFNLRKHEIFSEFFLSTFSSLNQDGVNTVRKKINFWTKTKIFNTA
ncbi:P-loop NTPase family protein [Wigglesworthia glossinidia]|uniref:hypothetical protein n=1 Tax=Wigglesworthia glossinidia TaxID=51229 RepID=UPI0003181489|nr:hypothetical protein [Wigglesworthia glossinidia]